MIEPVGVFLMILGGVVNAAIAVTFILPTDGPECHVRLSSRICIVAPPPDTLKGATPRASEQAGTGGEADSLGVTNPEKASSPCLDLPDIPRTSFTCVAVPEGIP